MDNLADTLIPFGKFKEQKVGDVPGSYLLWMEQQEWWQVYINIQAYIDQHRTKLQGEADEERQNYRSQK